MTYFDEIKLPYLETGIPRMDLGPGLLQTRSSTRWSRDKAPGNSIMRSTASASKNLSNAEKRDNIIYSKKLVILYRLKSSISAVCKRGEYNHRS